MFSQFSCIALGISGAAAPSCTAMWFVRRKTDVHPAHRNGFPRFIAHMKRHFQTASPMPVLVQRNGTIGLICGVRCGPFLDSRAAKRSFASWVCLPCASRCVLIPRQLTFSGRAVSECDVMCSRQGLYGHGTMARQLETFPYVNVFRAVFQHLSSTSFTDEVAEDKGSTVANMMCPSRPPPPHVPWPLDPNTMPRVVCKMLTCTTYFFQSM